MTLPYSVLGTKVINVDHTREHRLSGRANGHRSATIQPPLRTYGANYILPHLQRMITATLRSAIQRETKILGTRLDHQIQLRQRIIASARLRKKRSKGQSPEKAIRISHQSPRSVRSTAALFSASMRLKHRHGCNTASSQQCANDRGCHITGDKRSLIEWHRGATLHTWHHRADCVAGNG